MQNGFSSDFFSGRERTYCPPLLTHRLVINWIYRVGVRNKIISVPIPKQAANRHDEADAEHYAKNGSAQAFVLLRMAVISHGIGINYEFPKHFGKPEKNSKNANMPCLTPANRQKGQSPALPLWPLNFAF